MFLFHCKCRACVCLKLYFELNDLVNVLSVVAKKFMKEKGILNDITTQFVDQLGSYILYSKKNILDYEMEYIGDFNFDFKSIATHNFEIDPEQLRRSSKIIKYRFFHSNKQKNQIANALLLHKNHPTGAPMIYQQNLKLLYRNIELHTGG